MANDERKDVIDYESRCFRSISMPAFAGVKKWKKTLTQKSHSLKCGFAILMLVIIPCLQTQATLVHIDPQSVRTKEVFTVDVVCDPTEPVKGWEFKVSYDARTLKLIDIREGDFFHGYQTFYRSNGTIAYGLIMGKDGNVSEKGVLATITFQALRHQTTMIRLVGTGVCNERVYIPITVIDGSVKIKKWFIFPDRLMTACGH